MKKNGFVATSILYSFFIVFLALFLALVASYIQNQTLINRVNEEAKSELETINNVLMTDLKVGDHVRFMTKTGYNYINDKSSWVLAYKENNGIYYFLSDNDAQNVDVYFKMSSDLITKYHPVTLDVYEELVSSGAYSESLKLNGLEISVPTMSILEKIRTQDLKPSVLNSIYNTSGSYVVQIDEASTAYTDPIGYYYYRAYSFSDETTFSKNNKINSALVNDYCNGALTKTGLITYGTNNSFGYINTELSADGKKQFVSYCYYASPIGYTHKQSDGVVSLDETVTSDAIDSKASSMYTLRLMASYDTGVSTTYAAGGKGTSKDPYIFVDGVKQ